MRTRTLAVTAILVVALLAGAGGVLAYDHGRQGTIAKGIRVNGVDVGGLTAEQARIKLRSALLEPLNRPVRARYGSTRFKLTARRAQIGVDIDGSVARALERSRRGNVLARTWREVRGERVDADLEARVTYSRAAVRRLVAHIQKAIDRPAQDATLDLSAGQVNPQPSHDGRAVRARRLRRDLQRALLDSGARHPVRVRTTVVKPNVSSEQLAARYPAVIIINRGAFRLTLYKHLKPAKTYPIAVGRVGLETPAGLYHVQNKAVNPAWTMPDSDWVAPADRGKVVPGGSPENPLKARWLGIYAGAGIHGTNEDSSIGSAASHGCIRMHIPDVIELYPQVPVGAPVYIS